MVGTAGEDNFRKGQSMTVVLDLVSLSTEACNYAPFLFRWVLLRSVCSLMPPSIMSFDFLLFMMRILSSRIVFILVADSTLTDPAVG